MDKTITITIKDSAGKEVVFTAEHREFKSGKVGYGCYEKASIDGKKHQLSMNVVEIGSGPAKEEKADKEKKNVVNL